MKEKSLEGSPESKKKIAYQLQACWLTHTKSVRSKARAGRAPGSRQGGYLRVFGLYGCFQKAYEGCGDGSGRWVDGWLMRVRECRQ